MMVAEGKKHASAIITNFTRCPSAVQDAPRAKFILERLSYYSGERKQSILVKSLLNAFGHPRYAEYRERIEAEWKARLEKDEQ